MICNRFDLALVLFPFTENIGKKFRPAVALTGIQFNTGHNNSLCAMVTTAANTQWQSDVIISNLGHAGLRFPSVVRLKFFTLQNDMLVGRIGCLDRNDSAALEIALDLIKQ